MLLSLCVLCICRALERGARFLGHPFFKDLKILAIVPLMELALFFHHLASRAVTANRGQQTQLLPDTHKKSFIPHLLYLSRLFVYIFGTGQRTIFRFTHVFSYKCTVVYEEDIKKNTWARKTKFLFAFWTGQTTKLRFTQVFKSLKIKYKYSLL